jgi:hypothetical protein
MGSDPLRAEAVRALIATAALLAGLASAAIIRCWMRRGDETRRFIIIMVAFSAAAASGAAAFIQAAHLGQAPVGSLSYGAAGFAAGLLAGVFPRAAGIPVVAIPLIALGVATASLGTWSVWTDDLEAARLSVYSATDMATKGVLTVAVPRGRTTERDVELKPGPVTVVVEALDIRGPLSLVFGSKRFRVASLRAGPDAIDLGDHGARLLDPGAGGMAARALGLSASTIEANPFAPLELSTATWHLGSDGVIRLEAPIVY